MTFKGIVTMDGFCSRPAAVRQAASRTTFRAAAVPAARDVNVFGANYGWPRMLGRPEEFADNARQAAF